MDSQTRDGRAWEPEYLIAIDSKTCIGCGRCFKVCGRNVMTLKGLQSPLPSRWISLPATTTRPSSP